MNHAYRLPLLAATALLSACAHTSGTLQIQNQAQCPLMLDKGQQLILSLPSDPTTGYRWVVRENAAAVLKSLGPEVYSAGDGAELVGADGHSIWRFSALRTGQALLQLAYIQPWDAAAEPARRFNCPIQVR
jgi:inhibitor of cysteine peptidase